MGVVGIVDGTPYCSMGGMVHVASGVRPPCTRSLAPRPRLGRGVNCARGWGSSRAEIALETQGSGEAEPASEAKRLGRDGVCARGQGAQMLLYSFCRFLSP